MNKIIQSSPPRTCSTVLLNLLYGFFSPEEEFHYPTREKIHDFFITQTRHTNVDTLMNRYKQYKLYFVMSERDDNKISHIIKKKYKNYDNVLVINYNEMNETNELSLENIIENIFNKFKTFFPKNLIPKKTDILIKKDMMDRIINMNKLYEKIKDKPFSYCDKFYGIHGSHRKKKISLTPLYWKY